MEKQAEDAKHNVFITVPKRRDWPSYWCLQKEFQPGSYQLEVTDQQLAELKEDPVIVLSMSPPTEIKVAASKVNAGGAEFEPAEEVIGKKLKVSKAVR